MASSISSILGRKVLPATVFVGGISHLFDGNSIFSAKSSPSTTSCEAPTAMPWKEKTNNNNPFLAPQLPETVLRKRMTSVGRFSLKSETKDNRSIPTFFLALTGEKKKEDDEGNNKNSKTVSTSNASDTAIHKFSPRKIFTVSDFEDAWLEQDMPSRHPRFHSTVCSEQEYFEETHHVHPPSSSSSSSSTAFGSEEGEGEESSMQTKIKAELDRHASETMHFSVYRQDLRNRLQHMLMLPLDVSDKLWEVKISNGLLGTSGAISRAKVDAIRKANRISSPPPQQPLPKVNGVTLSRTTTKGGLWRAATQEAESIPMESVLLFRSHHALADGASIMAAFSDLCDEAEEIRAELEAKLKQWKRKGGGPKKSALRRMLSRLLRLLKMCLWLSFGTLGALVYQGYLQITTPTNPFDAVREDAERKGLSLSGRSISWCDAAPLEEVKRIAEIIGKSKGIAVTVNDLFVSCVTSAVARQLTEHEELMAPVVDARKRNTNVPRSINVVVPVHMRGGVILPNESVGNNIGAFVTRCPGEMKFDAVDGGAGAMSCPSSERLHQVHKSLLYSKRSPAPFVSHHMAKFCSEYIPEEWAKSIFQRANANACVAVSNTRGYDKKLHIRGMTVESVAGFLPLPPGIPVGVVVQSYAGTMSLTLTAEKWAVPDADKFLSWVVDEYQRLRVEASQLEEKQTSAKLLQ